nr:hypothetical protein [uncultured Roseateles sp.]
MPSATELIDFLEGPAAVARLCRVKPPSVSEWRERGIPDGKLIRLAPVIERRRNSKYRRWDLFPTDWHEIWPELVGTEGAPPVPAPRPAEEALHA